MSASESAAEPPPEQHGTPGPTPPPERNAAPGPAPAADPSAPPSSPGSPVTADRIMEIGMGFWPAKALLSAVELGLYPALSDGPRTAAELRDRIGLHPRAARDFLDALVALGLLARDGDGEDSRYANTPETARFLVPGSPGYLGGFLAMANTRLYGFWGRLTDGLRTGRPQNEIRDRDTPGFDARYADPVRLRMFLQAMTGLTRSLLPALGDKFPWDRYKSVADIGCGEGSLLGHLLTVFPHLTGAGFDLPPVGGPFEEFTAAARISDRVRFVPGDFLRDSLPSADVLVFGRILHDWDRDTKLKLLAKAHEVLPEGGAVIVYESLVDDARRTNAFGLLMSLNMLVETPGGFDFTAADCRRWLTETGFRSTSATPLYGPEGMVVGIK